MKIVNKSDNYRRQLKQQLELKTSDIISKPALNYHPKENRNRGKL